MQIESTSIADVYVVRPEPILDHRGYFVRTYCQDSFSRAGITTQFVQTNSQFSPAVGTLRGLHYQTGGHAEIKYVRCVRGRTFDVAVDLRPESPTYLSHFALEIDVVSGVGLIVGRGCAHGFLTLDPNTEVTYMTDQEYAPAAATGVRWDDPAFDIRWPIPVSVISDRDADWALLR